MTARTALSPRVVQMGEIERRARDAIRNPDVPPSYDVRPAVPPWCATCNDYGFAGTGGRAKCPDCTSAWDTYAEAILAVSP